jgi:hypothetical protein
MGYCEEYWKQYAISRLLVSISKLNNGSNTDSKMTPDIVDDMD